MVADIDLLVVQEHTVDSLDSGLGSLSSLVVDETVALGAAVLVGGDLAGQDVAESSEGVMEGLQSNCVRLAHVIAGAFPDEPCCQFARPGS